MTYPSASLENVPVYRPKRIPRVIRRQMPVVQICVLVALAGALFAAISWRNVYNDRLTLDVGMQSVHVDSVNKEIRQLRGMIEQEASFPRVSRWARDNFGWKSLAGAQSILVVPESALSPSARQEWKFLESAHE